MGILYLKLVFDLTFMVDFESNNNVGVADCHEVEGIEPRSPLLLVFAHTFIVFLRLAVFFFLDAQTSNLCYLEIFLVLLGVNEQSVMALPHTALLFLARLGLILIFCLCIK